MRVFIPHISWEGNFGEYFIKAFQDNGVQVFTNCNRFRTSRVIRYLGLREINKIQEMEREYYSRKYGQSVVEQCIAAKPDVFIAFNESKLGPEFIQCIKEKCKCLMVLLLGDDPWDSIRWTRDFPHSLKYYDLIFSADPSWNNNIRKVAPKAKVFWHFGGYDESIFYKRDKDFHEYKARPDLNCDLAFTGSSYGRKAEGAYRSDVLSALCDYDLKIWGGDKWAYRFKFTPCLMSKYQGKKLSYDDLRILYSNTKMFLNLPAPQVASGFQPRVFEIGACGGFQIADNRPLLRYMFTENELVVFNSIAELRSTINYFLDNENERCIFAKRLYDRVIKRYRWTDWAKRVLDTIRTGTGIQDLDILLVSMEFSELSELLRNA